MKSRDPKAPRWLLWEIFPELKDRPGIVTIEGRSTELVRITLPDGTTLDARCFHERATKAFARDVG
jgi:hypothetical protein